MNHELFLQSASFFRAIGSQCAYSFPTCTQSFVEAEVDSQKKKETALLSLSNMKHSRSTKKRISYAVSTHAVFSTLRLVPTCLRKAMIQLWPRCETEALYIGREEASSHVRSCVLRWRSPYHVSISLRSAASNKCTRIGTKATQNSTQTAENYIWLCRKSRKKS